ncbi:cysteine hydrolase family protein [Streptomyces sp. C36]|uniref:cysteine hydrolase family protein n=1 Tax=Streptomyces sp. C36 TaxID=3237122 RepID=UPI0034C63F1C
MTDAKPTLDPRRTALLVMDYQPSILGSLAAAAPDLLDKAATAIDTVRDLGGRIGYVRVAFTDADCDAIPAVSPIAAMATPELLRALHADVPGTAVHERLTPHPQDIVVRKTRIGAFSTTDLDDRLRTAGIDTLVLAGVATSGVVLSTLRDAADRDYRLVVLADACADHDPAVHNFLTDTIFPRQAHVTTTAQLPTLFREQR